MKLPEDLAIFINQQLWIWESKKFRSRKTTSNHKKYLRLRYSSDHENEILVPDPTTFRVSKVSIQIKNL